MLPAASPQATWRTACELYIAPDTKPPFRASAHIPAHAPTSARSLHTAYAAALALQVVAASGDVSPTVAQKTPSIAATVRAAVIADGLGGLFLGGAARVAKRALSTAITWTLFEEAMRRGGGGSSS